MSAAQATLQQSVAHRHGDELWVCQLGVVPYREALRIQTSLRELRRLEEVPDLLLLLEHPPVYTRGRRSCERELPLGEDFYRRRGIEVVGTDRGGKLTYHGPGQLVGYPIMRVDDVGAHLRLMEQAIIQALGQEGVRARSRCQEGPDYTGVWVQERKIASIGVHLWRGISTHGFAVNVENDMEPFSWVQPCGLAQVTMTSLALERPARSAGLLNTFTTRVADEFCSVHRQSRRNIEPAALGLERLLAA